jgi:hypothetical protein
LLAVAAPAAALEVARVNVPETVAVGGKTLKLNGAGIRKSFIIKVYVGAPYLETPFSDASAIVSSDQARSVRMRFLRDVDKANGLVSTSSPTCVN